MKKIEYVKLRSKERREMKIKINEDMNEKRVIEEEGVMVMSEEDEVSKDISKMRIGIINMMKKKVKKEKKIESIIGEKKIKVEMKIVRMKKKVERKKKEEKMI